MSDMSSSGNTRSRLLQKILIFLQKKEEKICMLSYIAGIIAIIVLPALSQTTYVDENSLLPGAADPLFGMQESYNASIRENQLWGILSEADDKPLAVVTWIQQQLTAMGVHSTQHKFSPIEFPHKIRQEPGTSVVAVVRSQRGTGNEAIVLVTPFQPPILNGTISVSHGFSLSLSLSLLSLLSRVPWLSKDIIWLAADSRYGAQVAVSQWLSDYHGRFPISGVLSAGIVIQLDDSWQGLEELTRVELKVEGPDGHTPNLDILVILQQLAARETLTVFLDSWQLSKSSALGVIGSTVEFLTTVIRDLGLLQKKEAITQKEYLNRFSILGKFLSNQVWGVASDAHGPFRDFQIDALTAKFYSAPSLARSGNPKVVSAYRVGRVLESSIRSLNNLLEKLHHSHFMYLLASPTQFVPLSMSLLPFLLLLLPFPLKASMLASRPPFPESQGSECAGIDAATWRMICGPWFRAGLTVGSVYVWGFCTWLIVRFGVAGAVAGVDASFMAWIGCTMTLGVVLGLVQVLGGVDEKGNEGMAEAGDGDEFWRLLKALTMGVVGVAIGAFSCTNFALALVSEVVLVPVVGLARPLLGRRQGWSSSSRNVLVGCSLVFFPLLSVALKRIACGADWETVVVDYVQMETSALPFSCFVLLPAILLSLCIYCN